MTMQVRSIALSCAALLLSACGAEVAGTAAAVGKLQATQAQQAQAQQERIRKQMDAALQKAQAAASAALEQ
jgi:outer membrane lipopolysaccharide assembly protein LptE/RlpB